MLFQIQLPRVVIENDNLICIDSPKKRAPKLLQTAVISSSEKWDLYLGQYQSINLSQRGQVFLCMFYIVQSISVMCILTYCRTDNSAAHLGLENAISTFSDSQCTMVESMKREFLQYAKSCFKLKKDMEDGLDIAGHARTPPPSGHFRY